MRNATSTLKLMALILTSIILLSSATPAPLVSATGQMTAQHGAIQLEVADSVSEEPANVAHAVAREFPQYISETFPLTPFTGQETIYLFRTAEERVERYMAVTGASREQAEQSGLAGPSVALSSVRHGSVWAITDSRNLNPPSASVFLGHLGTELVSQLTELWLRDIVGNRVYNRHEIPLWVRTGLSSFVAFQYGLQADFYTLDEFCESRCMRTVRALWPDDFPTLEQMATGKGQRECCHSQGADPRFLAAMYFVWLKQSAPNGPSNYVLYLAQGTDHIQAFEQAFDRTPNFQSTAFKEFLQELVSRRPEPPESDPTRPLIEVEVGDEVPATHAEEAERIAREFLDYSDEVFDKRLAYETTLYIFMSASSLSDEAIQDYIAATGATTRDEAIDEIRAMCARSTARPSSHLYAAWLRLPCLHNPGLDAGYRNFSTVVVHELFHVWQAQLLGIIRQTDARRSWVNEGTAEWVSIDFFRWRDGVTAAEFCNPNCRSTARRILSNQRFPDFDDIRDSDDFYAANRNHPNLYLLMAVYFEYITNDLPERARAITSYFRLIVEDWLEPEEAFRQAFDREDPNFEDPDFKAFFREFLDL